MRRILLVIFIFISGVILAQNYNPINPVRESWFEDNSWYNPKILPVRIDSVRIYGNDTSYFNYKLFGINNITTYCIDPKDTNFFVDRMIAQPNGNHLFFNRYSDTILIKPFSGIGNSWVLFQYANGDYIEAKVDTIIQQTFFGNPDSVKIISLQAKDAANNPINNIFNGKEIRIGKNNGLTHFYNTIEFPADTLSYDLVGKSNPDEGITNLTAAKIYDWNIGDEFQYQGGYNQMSSGSMHEYEQFVILTKTISANSDTITYNKDHIYYRKNYYWSPTFDSTMYFVHDTVSQTVIISAPDLLNHYPYEYIDTAIYFGSGFLYQFNDNQYQIPNLGKLKKTVDSNYYMAWDSCVQEAVITCPHYFTYAEGIGFVCDRSLSSMGCSEKWLVYYHKGNITWGTPLDWLAITNVNSDLPKNSAVAIFPNPTSGIFSISSSEKIVKIEITDELGKKVENLQCDISKTEFDLSAQSKGIYFVKILDESGNSSVRKIIVE